MTNTNTARVYVGTYAKYNSGSIQGAWVDLDDYTDMDSFIDACNELHSDEGDPELMFQDYEGFPASYYGESGIDGAVFEWLAMDDEEREMLAAYREHISEDGTLEDARDAYCGHYSTKLDYAYEFIEITGMLDGVPDTIAQYFDYESFARDLFDDYTWADGHVFHG